MVRGLLRLAAVACAFLVASAAQAALVIPGAIGSVSVAGQSLDGIPDSYGSQVILTGNVASTSSGDANGFGSALLRKSPDPYLTAHVTSCSCGSFNEEFVGASSELSYFFGISSPTDMLVPVSIRAILGASFSEGTTSGLTGGEASFGVFDYTLGDQLIVRTDVCSTSNAPSCISAAAINGVYFVPTNHLMIVNLSAGAQSGNNAPVGETAEASSYVDPSFHIESSFLLDHPGLSIAFSEGIGNPNDAIPEPAAWALLVSGCGVAGLGLRGDRRRRRTTAH